MTPCCSVWALLKGPAHPQAAMPPPNGAEGTDESYSSTYNPYSEESEEERETQSEKEGKTEFEALLAARHRHAAFEAQHRHDIAPPGALQALVTARIWEPPELG